VKLAQEKGRDES